MNNTPPIYNLEKLKLSMTTMAITHIYSFILLYSITSILCYKTHVFKHNVFSEAEKNYKTLDTPHLYQDVGVLREPSGMYLPYGGSIIIPFVYSIPHIKTIQTSCNISESINRLYIQMKAHIRSILDIPSNEPRQKRQLFMPIAVGLSSLLGFYNTYEEHTLKTSLEYMKENQNIIKDHVKNLDASTNIIIDRINHISVIMGEHSQQITQVIKQLRCEQEYHHSDLIALTSLITLIPLEFISAYNSAISEKVNPLLLSSMAIGEIITQHPSLENTMYERDQTLVYELGSTLVTHVSLDHNPTFMGIIYLPKLLRTNPVPMYTFYSVNIISGLSNIKLKLPTQMICEDDYTCWEFIHDKCIKTLTKVVCLQNMVVNHNTCLISLKTNSTKGCEIQVSSDISDTILIQTGSGILTGGTTNPIKTYIHDGNTLIPSITIPASPRPRLITKHNASFILYKDNIYSTLTTGYNTNVTYTFHEHDIFSHIKDISQPTWTDLKYISDKRTWIEEPHHYISISSIIIAIIMSSIMSVLLYYYCHKRHLYTYDKTQPLDNIIIPKSSPHITPRRLG